MPSLFSKPKIPQVVAPAVMPTPDDAAVQDAKRQQMAAMMARSGRQSTYLSDETKNTGAPAPTLGG